MDRISRYSGLKNRSSKMALYIKTLASQSPNDHQTQDIAKKVSSCAHYLLFHDYYTVDQLRLVKAITCKKTLLCPFCAARRAAKSVDRNLPKVSQILTSNRSLKPVMITLTVKNGESLPERYMHLKQAYTRLQQRRRDTIKGTTWSEFGRVAGGIHSYEFSRSPEGWHPHIHIVALLDSYIDQKALSAEWLDITGDSFIVDVRRISPGEDGLASGMLEVFKYALKFQDLDHSDTWHAHTVLNTRRLVGCFGILRGIQEPESLLDETLDDLPYNQYLYLFSHKKGTYDLQEIAFQQSNGAVNESPSELHQWTDESIDAALPIDQPPVTEGSSEPSRGQVKGRGASPVPAVLTASLSAPRHLCPRPTGQAPVYQSELAVGQSPPAGKSPIYQ